MLTDAIWEEDGELEEDLDLSPSSRSAPSTVGSSFHFRLMLLVTQMRIHLVRLLTLTARQLISCQFHE